MIAPPSGAILAESNAHARTKRQKISGFLATRGIGSPVKMCLRGNFYGPTSRIFYIVGEETVDFTRGSFGFFARDECVWEASAHVQRFTVLVPGKVGSRSEEHTSELQS